MGIGEAAPEADFVGSLTINKKELFGRTHSTQKIQVLRPHFLDESRNTHLMVSEFHLDLLP